MLHDMCFSLLLANIKDVPQTAKRGAVAGDAFEQRETVGDADTSWLTMPHTTHFVRSAYSTATLEAVARSCVHQIAYIKHIKLSNVYFIYTIHRNYNHPTSTILRSELPYRL